MPSLLMPSMLLGSLGMLIPVVIHLLHRQQTQPVRWGAMQFLQASPLQARRRKKVDHWLLMLLRMLAVALLACALARPRVPRLAFIPRELTDAPVDVAVVVEHSLSTGRLSAGQTVFDRAIGLAGKIVEQLKPSDTISVVLAEHTPRLLTDLPAKKADAALMQQIHDQLLAEPPGMTDCNMPDAIAVARRLLAKGSHSSKLIVVLSDQQRNHWHIDETSLWRAAIPAEAQAIPVHLLPILPDTDFDNLTVSSLQIHPTIIGGDRPVQISATVANTGTRPMPGVTVQLLINEKQVDSKPITPLAIKSSSTVTFGVEASLFQTGSNSVKVAIDTNDALAADNQAVAAANVLQHLPVLIIDGQFSDAGTFESSQFLKAALQPQDHSLIDAQVVSLSGAMQTNLDDYKVVVVNDAPGLPDQLRDRLTRYARSGHGVWFILGRRTQPALIQRDLAGLFPAEIGALTNGADAGGTPVVRDTANAVMKLLTSTGQNSLTGMVTRNWQKVTPADAQVVMSAANGDPLVMERSLGDSGGVVELWASSVDGSWNNWNLTPNFVPLVNETIYHLAASSMHGLENRSLEAGQPIEWAGNAAPMVKSVQIELPDHTSLNRPAIMNNGRWLVTYPDTDLPGLYKMRFQPAEISPVYFGVNIDRAELDPAAMDASDLNWLKASNYLDAAHPVIAESDLPEVLRRQGQPPEIWGFLAAVLLASLLCETYLTYRLAGRQKQVDVAGAGLTPVSAGA